jgi:lipoic acid synthetase
LTRLPPWLTQRAPDPSVITGMKNLFDGLSLHTVCESAHCPNQGECFSKGTATFLILGDVCTRNCRFCAVMKGTPSALDPEEPQNVARAVDRLGLRYVVITSVTRDDLPNGGAEHFARTVDAVRQSSPRTYIELLIPDFQGSTDALRRVVASAPHVISHNLETVPRLYPEVRATADYRRSLDLLRMVKSLNGGVATKSGLMLGLGERYEEVITAMENLREVDCDILTLGQYLCPSAKHREVSEFITPQIFEEYQTLAGQMGFKTVASAPFVRSSFNALGLFEQAQRT